MLSSRSRQSPPPFHRPSFAAREPLPLPLPAGVLDAIADKKRELETMKLKFEWIDDAASRQYWLALSRHMYAPAHAVSFDMHSATFPDGKIEPIFPVGVAVRGERLVTILLVRLLMRYRAVKAAAQFELQCWLSQGSTTVLENLQPIDVDEYEFDDDDPESLLEATRDMVAELAIADALLLLCTNGAV